ncbi:hypothetical protein VNO77_02234 [Canavalia gladiata]|uniref:Uncharacterized protein n=1 Tax=Canavalia gladiata TaxID=3824 RepID=A0AAN9MUN4_CANGL
MKGSDDTLFSLFSSFSVCHSQQISTTNPLYRCTSVAVTNDGSENFGNLEAFVAAGLAGWVSQCGFCLQARCLTAIKLMFICSCSLICPTNYNLQHPAHSLVATLLLSLLHWKKKNLLVRNVNSALQRKTNEFQRNLLQA